MSREERDKKNREFQYSKEQVDELMREMEADPQAEDREIPDEWEQAFRQTIEKAFEEKHRRERKRRNRITALAACAVLVVGVGMNSVMEVQGDSLLETVRKIFDTDREQYITYNTDEMFTMDSVEKDSECITFSGESIQEVYAQVKEELKRPIFQHEDVFGEYTIEKAEYDQVFQVLTIELKISKGAVFISQRMLVENGGDGGIGELCIKNVYNDILGCEIPIYASEREKCYVITAQKDQMIFSLSGEASLEECERLAESLEVV